MALLADTQDQFGGPRIARFPDWSGDTLVNDIDAGGFAIDRVRINGQFDPRAFGASYDEVTDDSAAIMECCAAARSAGYRAIQLSGRSYMASPLEMGFDNWVSIIGNGNAGLITDQDMPLIEIDTSDGRIDGLQLKNIWFINSNNSATTDSGIKLIDSATGNSMERCLFADLHFWGLTYGIWNARSADQAEGGLNASIFSRLFVAQGGGKMAKKGIWFEYGGGGTGNQFGPMSILASEHGILMGNDSDHTQNVGDLKFRGIDVLLGATGCCGIELIGGDTYGNAVSVMGCQFDGNAGLCHALKFTDITGFSCVGNNLGGNTDVVLTNCENGTLDLEQGLNNLSTPNLVLTNCTGVKFDRYGGSWEAYTPTIAAGMGSFGSVGPHTGRYKQVGKTVYVEMLVTITTKGTAAQFWTATLPVQAAAFPFVLSAVETVVSAGTGGWGYIAPSSSTIQVAKYDGTYLGEDGYVIAISGTYEAA